MSWIQNILWVEGGALLVMVLCAVGYRFHILPFKPAFIGFLFLALVLSICAVITLVSIVLSPSINQVPQLVLGLLPALAFVSIVGIGGFKVPKIHDISTRVDPPIIFELADKQRTDEHNSILPANEQTLAQQHSYYSEIEPLIVEATYSDCFSKVEQSITDLGWGVHGMNKNDGWLEVFDQSVLFGFVDDVRIEIVALPNGHCQIDVRSVSRVGLSDLGANARRIQRLFKRIKP